MDKSRKPGAATHGSGDGRPAAVRLLLGARSPAETLDAPAGGGALRTVSNRMSGARSGWVRRREREASAS